MRFFGNRQDDTTNSQEPNTRFEYGWGSIPVVSGGVTLTEGITFQTPFTNKPIVLICSGGDSTAGTTYGSGGNNIEGVWVVKAITITNTGFSAFARSAAQAAAGSNGTFFYHWVAIGK